MIWIVEIADMDFIGANKTRIVISESAMVKETAGFEVVHQAKCMVAHRCQSKKKNKNNKNKKIKISNENKKTEN